MINLAELEQYFPSPNNNIICQNFTFKISLSEDEGKDTFIVNLKPKKPIQHSII